MAPINQPHWERGDRAHGYWMPDGRQFGWIGLPPRGMRVDKPYSWSTWMPRMDAEAGKERYLATARRRVEAAYKMWIKNNDTCG